MYVFGIDIQANVLLGIGFVINFIELVLVYLIVRKMKKRSMHKTVQKEMEEVEE